MSGEVAGAGARRPVAEGRDGSDVYRALRDAIASGRFQPNERLVEADLAERFLAGRSSIRAALVRLDQEGLVTLEPHRGGRVRLISEREAIEIEEVRIVLERLLARQAALKVTDQDLEALRETIGEMRRRLAQADPLGYSELNAKYHQRIWAIADHQTAARLLGTLKSQSIRFQYRTILRPGRTARSLEEHEAILEALTARDPARSEAAMEEHLSEVVETLRWAIDAQQRPPRWLPG
ncbi:MAG TPA: GntR family transcriptional regulator [Candidatus Limnocylindrales bacterium]|nr:GntR family transcriptional regulator [Candidatus Limnocylindrales bacterium]